VFLHATGTRNGNASLELWVLRMAVLNSVVDPWVHIVLRRESLIRISGLYQSCCSRIQKSNKETEEGETEKLIKCVESD
jgi:hypothetical protein